jgi:hypothetical protein
MIVLRNGILLRGRAALQGRNEKYWTNAVHSDISIPYVDMSRNKLTLKTCKELREEPTNTNSFPKNQIYNLLVLNTAQSTKYLHPNNSKSPQLSQVFVMYVIFHLHLHSDPQRTQNGTNISRSSHACYAVLWIRISNMTGETFQNPHKH